MKKNMSCIDVFKKYYAFDKLPQDNKYYDLKRSNYESMKLAYEQNDILLKSFPIRATIQTTDFCNLNCIMCQIHSQRDRHKLQSMKKADFDLFVEKLFPYLVEVHPTNIGEPLTSEWFEYLCDKIVEYGVLLDLTTNGTLLTEKIAYKILPNLLDVKISFDGIKKETFERIRRNADYDLVIRNINNLLKIRDIVNPKGSITLQMTVFDFNYQELLDIIRFARDKGINRVKAYHVFAYSEEINKHSPFNNLSQFEETRIAAINLAKELNIDLEMSEPPNYSNDTSNLIYQKCRFPWSECWIDSDGNVYPCHTHNNRILGNIYTSDIESIWNSNQTTKLRKSLIDNDKECICTNCGMNYIKYDENQPVPYDTDAYLFKKNLDTNATRWSSRNRQFLLSR